MNRMFAALSLYAPWITLVLHVSGEIDDFTESPFNVLLTGFGPFLNFTYNPTMDIARRLGATCDDIYILPEPAEVGFVAGDGSARLRVCWHAYVLPVNRTGAVWTTQHLQNVTISGGKLPYDGIFHMGLEDGAKGFKLEVVAANIQAQDNGLPGHAPAIPGTPHILATTVNVGWLSLRHLALRAAPLRGRPSKELELWSRNAGSFYCNEVYYRTLQFVRSAPVTASTGAILPVMFLHVQNSTASSVREDVDAVRMVVAHALWATYVAPATYATTRAAARPSAIMTLDARGLACLVMCNLALGGLASMVCCRSGDKRRGQPLLQAWIHDDPHS